MAAFPRSGVEDRNDSHYHRTVLNGRGLTRGVAGRPVVLVMALVAFVASGVGCSPDGPGSGSGGGGERTLVVAGFFPLAEVATQVGGDLVRVADLVRPGGEPHEFELGADSIERVEAADLVLVARGVQPALDAAAERAGAKRLDIAVDGASIPEGDPHAWLDPLRLRAFAREVGRALGQIDPEHSQLFTERAERYAATLTELHERFVAHLGACDRRVIVTTHAAFGHLARRYDLAQEAVIGFGGEAEPTPGRLDEVARLIERDHLTTVFDEPGGARNVARTLARETGAKVATLYPLESLTPTQATLGATYVSVMDENLAALVKALGCDAGA